MPLKVTVRVTVNVTTGTGTVERVDHAALDLDGQFPSRCEARFGTIARNHLHEEEYYHFSSDNNARSSLCISFVGTSKVAKNSSSTAG